MTEPNPYTAPAANLEQGGSAPFRLTAPRSVAARRGWDWVVEGFGFFSASPGPWILALIVGLVIVAVLAFVPIVGQLGLTLTYYVWIGGLMLGCREQDKGRSFAVSYLFAGFSNPGKLMLLSLLMLVINFAVILVFVGPVYLEILNAGAEPSPEVIDAMTSPTGFWLPLLFAMLVMIPLVMALWFAPALIAINDCGLLEAMKLSFTGCLKNILPMLVYGIVALVIYVLGMIPLGLGLLVVGPTLFASMYVSYRDIFIDAT